MAEATKETTTARSWLRRGAAVTAFVLVLVAILVVATLETRTFEFDPTAAVDRDALHQTNGRARGQEIQPGVPQGFNFIPLWRPWRQYYMRPSDDNSAVCRCTTECTLNFATGDVDLYMTVSEPYVMHAEWFDDFGAGRDDYCTGRTQGALGTTNEECQIESGRDRWWCYIAVHNPTGFPLLCTLSCDYV